MGAELRPLQTYTDLEDEYVAFEPGTDLSAFHPVCLCHFPVGPNIPYLITWATSSGHNEPYEPCLGWLNGQINYPREMKYTSVLDPRLFKDIPNHNLILSLPN